MSKTQPVWPYVVMAVLVVVGVVAMGGVGKYNEGRKAEAQEERKQGIREFYMACALSGGVPANVEGEPECLVFELKDAIPTPPVPSGKGQV